MITAKSLTVQRGTKILLDHAAVSIFSGQKVGLIGENGCGKSTLFSLILGESKPDGGDLMLTPRLSIAHLSQETPASDESALEYVKNGDHELRKIEKALLKAEAENNANKLADLHMQYADIDGYSAESRAGKLLYGLGFTTEEQTKPVKEFSGGWRMRLNLAQTLMTRSDLMLLDEPTNHLDLETIIWLEKWLLNYRGTLLLISHDREFLDAIVDHIIHVEQKKLNLYTGNYSDFEKQRAAQLALRAASYEKQQRQVAHMQDFIRRFRAKASKAKQAQSRMKALDRMEIVSAVQAESPFHFEFREPEKAPDTLLRLDRVELGYGDHVVLKNINLTLYREDRIGLLGFNGAGKSTLIKFLAGKLEALQGERSESRGLKIGYFAQHQLEQLDLGASPLLHFQRMDPHAKESALRGFLGGFNFMGDMATTPITKFSGGEKARLALALIVWQKPNLLLLDEPTNHLDLEMRSALELALQTYDGAMILVSHDRYLLRATTNQFLLVADGRVEPFDGDMNDYEIWVKKNA